jgi:hypothetical protein
MMPQPGMLKRETAASFVAMNGLTARRMPHVLFMSAERPVQATAQSFLLVCATQSTIGRFSLRRVFGSIAIRRTHGNQKHALIPFFTVLTFMPK